MPVRRGPHPSRRRPVQFVLWSQWRQGAGFVKKPRPGPSTLRRGPPPRPARHRLVTARGARGGGRSSGDTAEPDLPAEGGACAVTGA